MELTKAEIAQIEAENDSEFEAEYSQASLRGLESAVGHARGVDVHFDRALDEIVLRLRGGMVLTVPRRLLQDVAEAAPDLVQEVELIGEGSALHWEKLDADFEVQSIVAGSFGSRDWMKKLETDGLLDGASIERNRDVDNLVKVREAAAALGRRGGQAGTTAQADAARQNGKKGGRPPGQDRFVLGTSDREEILKHLKEGVTQAAIAREFELSPSTLSRILHKSDMSLSEEQFKKLSTAIIRLRSGGISPSKVTGKRQPSRPKSFVRG